jgi:NTP pyrophosphatase (non-canonical NTP hydrolase)
MSNIKKLQARLTTFQQARNWTPKLRPANIAQALIVECAELVEIFQWSTTSEQPNIVATKKPEIESEVADIFAYLLTFCEATDIDLEQALRAKIKTNETRFPVPDKLSSI